MSPRGPLPHAGGMKTFRAVSLFALLLSSAILSGCAGSASAGASQAPIHGCSGQSANAHCFGGPP
jgi:hypothetical protein